MRLPIQSALAGAALLLAAPSEPAPPVCHSLGTVEGRQVWATADALVTFTANMDVNTDGALESYAVGDLGNFDDGKLNTHAALNTICNGARIRQRSAGPVDPVVVNYTKCRTLIGEFARIRDANWSPPDGRYVDFFAIARQPGTQQPRSGRGVPCVKNGYYVSQTAKAMNSTLSVCDPEHWIDAARIPAIVVPITLVQSSGVGLFDVAMVRKVGGQTWYPAIVGDTNEKMLGEGTLRLAQQVTGSTTRPANYRALTAIQPQGDYEYVIFPGSRSAFTSRSNDMESAIGTAARLLAERYNLSTRPMLCS